jgi:hypothetical protein
MANILKLGLALLISPKEFFEYIKEDKSYWKPFISTFLFMLIFYILTLIKSEIKITLIFSFLFLLFILSRPFYLSLILLVFLIIINILKSSGILFATYGEDSSNLPIPSYTNVFKVFCYSNIVLYLYYFIALLFTIYVPEKISNFSIIFIIIGNIHFLILFIIGIKIYEKISGMQIAISWFLFLGTINLFFKYIILTLIISYLPFLNETLQLFIK